MEKMKMLKMSDEEVLKHITTYEAPPAGFDPQAAEDRLLRKHGIPRRPDAAKEPHLRKLWDQAFATKPKFIKAEVAVDHVMAKRQRAVMEKKAAPMSSARAVGRGWSCRSPNLVTNRRNQ